MAQTDIKKKEEEIDSLKKALEKWKKGNEELNQLYEITTRRLRENQIAKDFLERELNTCRMILDGIHTLTKNFKT